MENNDTTENTKETLPIPQQSGVSSVLEINKSQYKRVFFVDEICWNIAGEHQGDILLVRPTKLNVKAICSIQLVRKYESPDSERQLWVYHYLPEKGWKFVKTIFVVI